MEGIIAAIITGAFALAGIIVSALITQKNTESAMKTNQAVTDEKISELTREVRKHNNFAEEIPVIKYQISELTSDVRHLQKYHQQ